MKLRFLALTLAVFFATENFARGLKQSDENQFVFGIYSNVKRRPKLFELGNQKSYLVYRFDYNSKIDKVNNRISPVWQWSGTRWRKFAFAPLPHVIYDYNFTQLYSKDIREKALNRKLYLGNDLKIPFILNFPSETFVRDKLAFADLMAYKNISHPVTKRFNKNSLYEAIEKNSDTTYFLKPIYGAQSAGIITLKKVNNKFHLEYGTEKSSGEWEKHKVIVNSKNELHPKITEIRNDLDYYNTPYIIQEGVDIYQFNNKNLYYRIFTQRDENAKLSVTGGIASIDGGVNKGGKEINYLHMLHFWEKINSDVFMSQKFIKDEIHSVSLNCHKAIEKHLKTKIGELGLDLVIDTKGKVFVLEANNKPGYAYFNRDKDRQKIHFNQKKDAFYFEIKRESALLGFGNYLFKSQVKSVLTRSQETVL